VLHAKSRLQLPLPLIDWLVQASDERMISVLPLEPAVIRALDVLPEAVIRPTGSLSLRRALTACRAAEACRAAARSRRTPRLDRGHQPGQAGANDDDIRLHEFAPRYRFARHCRLTANRRQAVRHQATTSR
jgi:hypothetical protein